MLVLGSIMSIVGLSLLWFNPSTGILIILVGLGIAWASEDQKVRKKNEKKLYEEENEREFNLLKFDDPISPKLFELSTILYGTIKPHEAWLLEQLDELEKMYSIDPLATIEQTQDIANGKFKNLFETEEKYQSICLFLYRDVSTEIFEDIEKVIKELQSKKIDNGSQISDSPNLNDILADYDLEEWAKITISEQISFNNDRNTIIANVIFQARKELNKSISVACLHDEWIIDGRIKFKI